MASPIPTPRRLRAQSYLPPTYFDQDATLQPSQVKSSIPRRRANLHRKFIRWRRKHPLMSVVTLLAAVAALLGLIRLFLPGLWALGPPDIVSERMSFDTSTTPDRSSSEKPSWSGEIPSQLLDYHKLDADELSGMVTRAKGFYARDYSLWLGWNNVRVLA